VKVFDNIISKKDQKFIKNNLLENNFPWYFLPDITHNFNEHQGRPGHYHLFMDNGKQNSDYINDIKKICENVNKKIKKQLDYANQKDIDFVVIIGKEELDSNKFKIKDMAKGEEIVFDDLNNIFKEINSLN